MFASLKALICGLLGEAKPWGHLEDDGCKRATAALLIRAANVDSDMSSARRDRLTAVLQSYFGCDDTEAAALIGDATKAAREAVDLYHFTRPINSIVDDEGRRRIVQMMWEIIYADGAASPLENNIVWRISDLLAVPTRLRVELRQRIAAQKASPVCCELPGTP